MVVLHHNAFYTLISFKTIAFASLALVAVQGYVHNLLPSDEPPGGGAPEAKKHHASLDVAPILAGEHHSPGRRTGDVHDWEFEGRGIPFKGMDFDFGVPSSRGDFRKGAKIEGEGKLGPAPGHEPANEGGPKGPDLPPLEEED